MIIYSLLLLMTSHSPTDDNVSSIKVELSFVNQEVRAGEALSGEIVIRNDSGYDIYIAPVGFGRWIVEPVSDSHKPVFQESRGSYAVPKRATMCYLPPEVALSYPAKLTLYSPGTFKVYREIGRDLPTDAIPRDCWSGYKTSNPVIVTVRE